MQDLIRNLETLSSRIKDATTKLGVPADAENVVILVKSTLSPNFWDDSVAASATSKHLATLQRHVTSWTNLQTEADEALELARLEQSSHDDTTASQVRDLYERVNTEFERRQFELKLSGKHDRSNAILEIHAGAGGADAQDWAQMLQRMYLRWAEREGFTA
jgi:peptide chain release factor 2